MDATDGWMDGIIYHCNGWMRKEIEHKFAFAANKYSALPQMLGQSQFFFLRMPTNSSQEPAKNFSAFVVQTNRNQSLS
jgi:hypothetical protein